jgi:GMP synthase PP-ATPase subunit
LPIGSTKKYCAVIRTFATSDFMTGRPAPLGGDKLSINEISFSEIEAIAEEIKKGFPEIEYVFYDITGKPPATCEWE